MSKTQGWHGNPEAHRKSGKIGGQTTMERYGQEFYKRISSKPRRRKRTLKRALALES